MERERYDLKHYENQLIDVYDNKLNSKRIMDIEEIFNLLNEQDKTIKLLTEYNKQGQSIMQDNERLNIENQQLKQSQNSKAIEVLERLRQDFFGNPYNGKHEYVVGEIIDKIDIKLTELRGKKND